MKQKKKRKKKKERKAHRAFPDAVHDITVINNCSSLKGNLILTVQLKLCDARLLKRKFVDDALWEIRRRRKIAEKEKKKQG